MNLYKRKRPINLNRFRYKVNQSFFKRWNSQMAYILGFTFADGNIHYCSLSWNLKNDIALLKKINKAMESNYPIKKRKRSIRLRISNPIILQDIQVLGVRPNKTKICRFPYIPEKFLRDFTRGFLDGDGWITAKKRKMEISVGFSNGSYEFLKGLGEYFKKQLSISTFNLRKRIKLTKNKKPSKTYMIEYYSDNAYKIIRYLYDGLKRRDLFLMRKYQKQLKARKIYEDLMKGPKLWRQIEKRSKMPMKELLNKLYFGEHLDGIRVAKSLKVHSSSIYRWLSKTGLKLSVPKRRRIVTIRCLVCNKKITRFKGQEAKYCSFKCRIKAKQTGRFVKCILCGKEIYRPNWWFKINNKPFCSRKCIGEWQRMRAYKNLLSRCKVTGQFLSPKGN